MTAAEYRKRAQECVELARNARDPDKAKLLEIAEAWRQLADFGIIIMPFDPEPPNPPAPSQRPQSPKVFP
jgi:hypothetical protein